MLHEKNLERAALTIKNKWICRDCVSVLQIRMQLIVAVESEQVSNLTRRGTCPAFKTQGSEARSKVIFSGEEKMFQVGSSLA